MELGPLTKPEALLPFVACGALHDSSERGPDAPKCHPETRTAVQRDILSWIQHCEQDLIPKRILWISGPAGTGKTALVGTIADEYYKRGLLAASFFFSASSGAVNRRSKKFLIPTLVYSLLQHQAIIGFKREVLAAIERDPVVFQKHLDQQIDTLILNPLRKVERLSDRRNWPDVVIIDGLDECQGEGESSRDSAQKEILCALSRACADPAFPFCIIVASRPEPGIVHFFTSLPGLIHDIFLDDKYDPDSDIRRFLEATFSDIRRRFKLLLSWPPEGIIDSLVKEASGQFIYVVTCMKFLETPPGPPQVQLEQLLQWRRLDSLSPFAPLDVLYARILQTSPDPHLAVKWLLFVDRHSLFHDDPGYIQQLLESYHGETEHVLGCLRSLVGQADGQGKPCFHFYHKSFLDFLRDRQWNTARYVKVEDSILFQRNRYYQILRGGYWVHLQTCPIH